MSMFDDKYFGYVASSFAITALVFLGLVVWLLYQHRTNRIRLAELEEQGITRRSSRASAASTARDEKS